MTTQSLEWAGQWQGGGPGPGRRVGKVGRAGLKYSLAYQNHACPGCPEPVCLLSRHPRQSEAQGPVGCRTGPQTPGEHSQAGLGASPLLSPPVPTSLRLTHPHPAARGALKCPSGHCLIPCNDYLVHSLETRSPTAHLSGLSFPPRRGHQHTVFAQICKVPAPSQGQPPPGMLSRIFAWPFLPPRFSCKGASAVL